MGRLRAASLLLAALAVGLLLAACGGSSDAELLPGTTADQINSNLDPVRESFNEGNCEEAEDAVAEVSTEVDGLQKVDKKLKAALKEGAAKLSEVVSSRCGASEEAEEEKAAEEAKRKPNRKRSKPKKRKLKKKRSKRNRRPKNAKKRRRKRPKRSRTARTAGRRRRIGQRQRQRKPGRNRRTPN